jgi:hypothetical protein
MAGPAGGSGTDAGGTGGGRSLNSCAEAGLAQPKAKATTTIDATRRRSLPHLPVSCHPQFITPCFSLKTRQIQACNG